MKYAIVVDSGCDLKKIEAENPDKIVFYRAPLLLTVGEKDFVDDYALDVEMFMKEMTQYSGKTGSAAPGPGIYEEFYKQADAVFVFTITGTLSGSYASAVAAKRALKEVEPEKKIFIKDTLSAGPEQTLLVKKTIELIEKGMEFTEIIEELEQYHKKTKLLFVLESLDNFVKNGRVSKLTGGVAGLLGIKILGCASEKGTLEVLKKCRGKAGAYDAMLEEMMKRGYEGGKVVITHCFNHVRADYLKEKIKEKFPHSHVVVMPTSGLCSYYMEKKGILLGFEGSSI